MKFIKFAALGLISLILAACDNASNLEIGDSDIGARFSDAEIRSFVSQQTLVTFYPGQEAEFAEYARADGKVSGAFAAVISAQDVGLATDETFDIVQMKVGTWGIRNNKLCFGYEDTYIWDNCMAVHYANRTPNFKRPELAGQTVIIEFDDFRAWLVNTPGNIYRFEF